MLYEQGNPEGISRYAYYLENPHGLFTPDIKQSLNLTKIAADKGNTFAITRYALFNLSGTCIPKNPEERWRLLNISLDRDDLMLYMHMV